MQSAPPSLYAGWGRRVTAWLIDLCAVILLVWIASRLLGRIGAPLELPIFAGYFVVAHRARHGQTIGKKVTGIAVRDAESLGRISWGRSLLRFAATALFWLLLAFPAFLDGLSPLWHAKHQSWHDRMVGTVVIRV